MYQGFYDLTSSMVTQNRNLNVISNNMTNVLTPGYKADTFVASTFREKVFFLYKWGGRRRGRQDAGGNSFPYGCRR